MTQFKFQDVVLINKVLLDNFGKERLFVWKDTTGRGWAIIKGILWAAPLKIPSHCTGTWEWDYYKPINLGHLGTFNWYGTEFDPKRKSDYTWHFESSQINHEINVLPPFDCTSCRHLIQIDEEECGVEDGGIVCEISWNEGDTYVCSSSAETEGHCCQHYQQDDDVIKYRQMMKECRRRQLTRGLTS